MKMGHWPLRPICHFHINMGPFVGPLRGVVTPPSLRGVSIGYRS